MVDFGRFRDGAGPLVKFVLVLLVVAIVALGWLGYSTLRDLTATRDELSAANDSLASTQASLATSQASVASQTSALADANKRVADLTTQLQGAASCYMQLVDEIAELERISGLQRDNFGRFDDKSKWGAANIARDKALTLALSDYYNAYQAAFDGQDATANSWIKAGNTQVGLANAKQATMKSEIAASNTASRAIEDALTALDTVVTATKTACQAPGT
jgi:septal ring factor EnvC (AmiA/AmiB activator)